MSDATSVSEAVGTQYLEVRFNPVPSEQVFSLNYSLGGTAALDEDYSITVSGTLNGNVMRFPVTIINDSSEEMDETIIVTLDPGSNYTVNSAANRHTLTIKDDDGPIPDASFVSDASSAGEGEGTQFVQIEFSPALPTSKL